MLEKCIDGAIVAAIVGGFYILISYFIGKYANKYKEQDEPFENSIQEKQDEEELNKLIQNLELTEKEKKQ